MNVPADVEVKSTLERLLEIDIWPEIEVVGNDIKIIIDDTTAFRRILTLENVDSVPIGKEGYYCQNLELVFKKEEGRVCLFGELEDPLYEKMEEKFGLTFEKAKVTVEVYNSCSNTEFYENPWCFLSKISFAIGRKADLLGEYCNSKEKELLPIIKEIVALNYWMESAEHEYKSFWKLKTLANKFGYENVEKLLTKLETIKSGETAFDKTAKKLLTLLCEQKYEPMWRELYNKIEASQVDYPNKVETLYDRKVLVEIRKDIQNLMETKGYIGIYPDFVKGGILRGIHLEQSYGMTYFVGMEKKAQYYIHCCESCEERDNLTIQFLCGTSFLKRDEDMSDIFECLFNAKGRRIFHTVYHSITLEHDLNTTVDISVKKAECIKLNKIEQKKYYGKAITGWGTFWQFYLIMGGMFGIATTLCMMLMCIIITIAFGRVSYIPEMLKIMPWGWILAIGWIGFGSTMGIIEVLARRK